MEYFDSFITADGTEIQVKCFDAVNGGTFNVFQIGDMVPTYLSGHDFEIILQYGEDFNIYPYELGKYIILIRNGKFEGVIDNNNLECNLTSFKTIDQDGIGINLEQLYKVIKQNRKKD